MKVYISQGEKWPFYDFLEEYDDYLRPTAVNLPKEKAEWIKGVMSEFHKVQLFLESKYMGA